VTKFPIKLPAVVSLAFLSIAFLGSFGAFTEARAIINCNTVCESGFDKCNKYCDTHNTYGGVKWSKCSLQCINYWHSGNNPQSKGRPNPTNPSGPPNKGVGPVKLKNPPTTVSNPNSPQPPLQIQERHRK